LLDDNATAKAPKATENAAPNVAQVVNPATTRLLFSFSKQGRGVFLSHLALMEVFSMAFIRAGIPILYSQGFNPQPRMSFASPLSIGIAADAEIATVDLAWPDAISPEDFPRKLNTVLPEGITVKEAMRLMIPAGAKKHSVPAMLWGFAYQNEPGGVDYVKAPDEKDYRLKQLGDENRVFKLRRTAVLSKNVTDETNPDTGISYFNAFRFLYPAI
jgi:radical SAM-linked protein